jgi:site-specific recombinase XerD
LIGEFLSHLEGTRGNTIRSRNTRLAAIRSFFRFLAFQEPGWGALIQQVLAIPTKRTDRRLIEYLTDEETQALIAAPDQSTWLGRRNKALLSLAIQTGLRVSELVSLRCQDLHLGHGAHVRCHGKGRKERCTPLRSDVISVLKAWVKERTGLPTDPLFPSSRGGSLSRDGVRFLLAKHVATAQARCPSIAEKKVTPHVLRHTAAMMLLESGVDPVVIALWLGHQSVETTQIYIHASLSLKEKALARTQPKKVGRPKRFQPDDKLLTFLEGL